MQEVVDYVSGLYPDLRFTASDTFCWSPETLEVMYHLNPASPTAIWSLLHETGHAALEHSSYQTDMQLLRLENAAWERAKELAEALGITIDEEHVQDCLDTYRDWLYRRSICPTCGNKCLQHDDASQYRCFNCHTSWKVTPSRFCRAYRSTQATKKSFATFKVTND